MKKILKKHLNLSLFVNPFFLMVFSFTVVILMYLLGWSDLYPKLSITLLGFLFFTFLVFTFLGIKMPDLKALKNELSIERGVGLKDFVFIFIFILGLVNVLLMGYIPFFEKSKDYREFGIPVIDPVFNSLCIFFSVFIFHEFLRERKSRYLLYVLLLIIFNFFIFRRSTIIWISVSTLFVYILHKRDIKLIYLITFIVLTPLFSYIFGSYGNKKSNLNENQILTEFIPSEEYINIGLGYNHYMTYIYWTSPLANLQLNVNNSEGLLNKSDFKKFLFYCIIPQSITLRLEHAGILNNPFSFLIHPYLIVGTVFMTGFQTLGWLGMFLILVYLVIFIKACLFVLNKWDTTSISTYSLLCTMVLLLTFSNFLIRLDVILILFIYPVGFHYLFKSRLSEVNV